LFSCYARNVYVFCTIFNIVFKIRSKNVTWFCSVLCCAEFSCKNVLSFVFFRINYWSWCWVDKKSTCVTDTTWPVNNVSSLPTVLQTPNAMDWSPCEALGLSADREMARLLWNLKVHCCVKLFASTSCPQPGSPVHTHTSCFSKIQVNIILQYAYFREVIFSLLIFPPKLPLFTSLQYVLYVLPTSPELSWSFALCLMESRLSCTSANVFNIFFLQFSKTLCHFCHMRRTTALKGCSCQNSFVPSWLPSLPYVRPSTGRPLFSTVHISGFSFLHLHSPLVLTRSQFSAE
jgi:hypothetical protein